MKNLALTATILTGLAASPLTALEAIHGADADGNGSYSLSELQVVYPDLTAEIFTTIDTNADGEADLAEVEAAAKAELLPSAG